MSENTTPSDPRVGEIQARLDAATPGPWRAARNEREVNMWVLSEDLMLEANLGYLGNHPEKNAYFIANAPADVAYLLAQLRARDEALGRVEALGAEMEAEAVANRNVATNLRNEWGSTNREETARHEQAAVIAENHATRIRAAVAAAKGAGDRG